MELDKHLHIISLNIPYPVDYGGVFDLFYKLPALKQLGIKIHLHCFKYGRDEQPILNDYCESVNYYERTTGPAALSLRYPYIVKSRVSSELAEKIAMDDYPVLMEGVHCTSLLNDTRFQGRSFFVRLHNVEHIYYHHLYRFSDSLLKKLYYLWESFLLKNYEKQIADKADFLSVTQKDAAVFSAIGAEKVHFLPLFLPKWKIKTLSGKGNFCLYHGDLSVAENEKAAKWLLTNVFDDIAIPFVVAGKNPSRQLAKISAGNRSTCIIANPAESEMQDLIEKAHINIIPSYNSTGIKLKLLNSLFNGRHCIVNQLTVDGTGLDKACYIATDASSFKNAVLDLYGKIFSENDLVLRHQLLDDAFDNENNALKLTEIIWPGQPL